MDTAIANDFQDLDEDFEYVFRYPQAQNFRLFDLPTELWLRICELAVTRPSPIDITRARWANHQVQVVKQPAITRTCRVLRHEGLAFFYQNNTFEAHHWGGVACIRQWLLAIGKENLKSMGTFSFHARFEPGFWVQKFEEIGLHVKVELSEDQSGVKDRRRYQTLLITFL